MGFFLVDSHSLCSTGAARCIWKSDQIGSCSTGEQGQDIGTVGFVSPYEGGGCSQGQDGEPQNQGVRVGQWSRSHKHFQ